jgi:hypothetical protein
MDKLVERENASRAGPLSTAPALAVQFFLIPLAVVAVVVLVYLGFRMLLADERTAEEYLHDIQFGSRQHRWPAAYELSRLMADPSVQAASPQLGPALVRAFENAKGDDPRLRRYLALAIARLDAPPPEAGPALIEALQDADSEIRITVVLALGSIEETSAVGPLQDLYQGSDDAGVRKAVVYTLGALPEGGQVRTLRTALQDPAPDVQWNAAVALARLGDGSGAGVLERMLDREYVEQSVTRRPAAGTTVDPAGEVIISSLRAIAALQEGSLAERVSRLTREDPNLQVRQAARETLEVIKS